MSNTTVAVPESVERDSERELETLLDRTDGERPWQIRDELAETMHENFGVFRREEQMLAQGDRVQKLRERYEQVVVEDKGEVFNSDLTQALELGFLLELAECMIVSGLARKESRGAHARPYDYPIETTRELPATHARDLGGRRSEARLEAGDDDPKGARGGKYEDAGPLKIWRYDAVSGQKALKEYEVEAPEVTLLDVLDLIKDKVDGTLAYRKSCRMMICGSAGCAWTGRPSSRARRACTTSSSPATCR